MTQSRTIETRIENFRKAYAANQTVVAAPALALQADPLAEGVLNQKGHVAAEFMFFGAGDDADEIDYTLWALTQVYEPEAAGSILVPQAVGTGVATMGAFTGVAGGVLGTADRICDTLTFAAGSFGTFLETLTNHSIIVFSPADNATPARLGIRDVGGVDGWLMQMTAGTGAPTGLNHLYHYWS